MQGIDVIYLLYFDIDLYHLRTKVEYRQQKFTEILRDGTTALTRENEKQRTKL